MSKPVKVLVFVIALVVNSMVIAADKLDKSLAQQHTQQKVAEYNYVLATQTLAAPYQFSNHNLLQEQAVQVTNLGSNILKVSLGKRSAEKYGFSEQVKGVKSNLSLIEKIPAYQKVFDMNFKYYQLWVHSFTMSNWSDGVSKKEAASYYQEMYELAEYLLKRYSGTGKVFMLGNWEGDWLLHGKGNRDSTPSQTRIKGMTDWLTIRQKAIDDAKAKVKHENVELYHYLEVNLVKKAMEGKASVAHSVLPNANVDLVSYSSYEAIKESKKPNIDAIRKPLTKIMDYLEGQLQPKSDLPFKRRVFIGEYGYHANKKKPETIKQQYLKSKYVAQVAIELDLPFALIWQMYNNEYFENGESKEMSLIDESGNKTLLYYMHKVFYQNMKHYVAQSYKKTGQAPNRQAFKEKAIKVLKNLSIKKVKAAKEKLEKLQKQKQAKQKKTIKSS